MNYEMGPVLGRGQFGIVYECTECSNEIKEGGLKKKKKVAVKVLKKGFTISGNEVHLPLTAGALSREVKILRLLKGSRNSLKLYSCYESPSKVFIVTEICSGGDLFTYLGNQRGSITYGNLTWIGFQVLNALNHCHEQGIVHRDVKPENILFKHGMEDSPLKLIDYGYAKSLRDEGKKLKLTAGGDNESHYVEVASQFAGTPFFVAPEVFAGMYSYTADMWSLGVIMCVIVSGYPATNVQVAFDLLQETRGRDLRLFPDMPRNLPSDFFDFIEDLLTVQASRRPSSSVMLNHSFVKSVNKLTKFDICPVMNRNNNNNNSSSNIINAGAIASPKTFTAKAKTSPHSNTLISLGSSMSRHLAYKNYRTYERKLSATLAVMLTQEKLKNLLDKVSEKEGSKSKELKICKVKIIFEVLEEIGESDISVCDSFAETYSSYAFDLTFLNSLVSSNPITSSARGAFNGVSSSKRKRIKEELTKNHGSFQCLDASVKGKKDEAIHRDWELQLRQTVHGGTPFS